MGNCCANIAAGVARPLPAATQEALRNLHADRATPFAPDGADHHLRLLRAFWRALVPSSNFARTGPAWKSLGFQGEDPATDIRDGGLLAVMCIEHMATEYTAGFHLMLAQVRAGAGCGDSESFYPISTTSVVLCTLLCDKLGLSRPMLGPVAPAALDALLEPGAGSACVERSPLLKLLNAGVGEGERAGGGFFELFAF